jgi:dTDP-4-dehydrorhamnose 3,5-epimerase
VIFQATAIPGAFVIELERHCDERGFFARTWCPREFEAHGLNPRLAQCSVSFNARKGTLRGLHYQAAPHEEAKLVHCTRGAIFDVAVDLRAGSAAFCKWVAVELSANNHRMFYIPEGCAHGFQTLEDDSEVFYQITSFYHPESSRGVPWNDPSFGIAWRYPPTVLSVNDSNFRPFQSTT